MLGFVFLAQFSDNSTYNDDTPRLRIAEIQEVTGDTEPPPQDGPPPNNLLSSILFICAGFVVLILSTLREVFPRLSFLSHVRPRSPPLL